MTGRQILVPAVRMERWVSNFGGRHGDFALSVELGALTGLAGDGAAFAASWVPPTSWGVLLVRKGGFAMARVAGHRIEESKVGQRHVQGRTKAGGQSQQRFSRRRDNQARAAYEAAAGHAHRILTGSLSALVCGGDRTAVEQVLEDPHLRRLVEVRVEPWLDVPDPRRAVLDQAVIDAASVAVTVTDP